MPAASPRIWSAGLRATKSISVTRPEDRRRRVLCRPARLRSASTSPMPSSSRDGTRSSPAKCPASRSLLTRAGTRVPLYAFSNTNQRPCRTFLAGLCRRARPFPRNLSVLRRSGFGNPTRQPMIMWCRRSAYRRQRIVFFDDLAENIDGARARGLTAVHVTSPDDVADALAALGNLGDFPRGIDAGCRRAVRDLDRRRRAARGNGRARRGASSRAGARRRGVAHPAAAGDVGDGRLCGAIGRCRARRRRGSR